MAQLCKRSRNLEKSTVAIAQQIFRHILLLGQEKYPHGLAVTDRTIWANQTGHHASGTRDAANKFGSAGAPAGTLPGSPD
jgi:hypothetical protein